MLKKIRLMSVLLLFVVFFVPVSSAGTVSVNETVVVYRQNSLARLITTDAFIKIGVGVLALLLFVVSAVVYYRDRRLKFLTVMLAFLLFTCKGILGLMDIMFPRDSSFILPFSDLFDLVILLMLFISVVKD